jgi:hypothetical protein
MISECHTQLVHVAGAEVVLSRGVAALQTLTQGAAGEHSVQQRPGVLDEHEGHDPLRDRHDEAKHVREDEDVAIYL